MLETEYIPNIEDLFKDLYHPNPNINKQAYLNMVNYWPKESMSRLILNLDHKDIDKRRKSVKALGAFGEKVLAPIAEVFYATKDVQVRTSCLKIFTKVASMNGLDPFPQKIINLIETALIDDTPEIILSVVPLLRQLEDQGLPFLIRISKDQNLLRASAAITALGEIDDPLSEECLNETLKDRSRDYLIHESANSALANYLNLKKR